MTIHTYRQYTERLALTPFNGEHMPYDWGNLPSTLDFLWLPYSQMFTEFSRELANVINELTRYTHRLAAWRDLLAQMKTQEKMDAAVEFINPIGTTALNLPYVIRSRFLVATAHLCHQANRAKLGPQWKDEFPHDSKIWFDSTDEFGAPWRGYRKLKLALERLASKAYQCDTLDYRNKYNHRFSPKIVLGLTEPISRNVDLKTGRVSYSIGSSPALTLEKTVPLLELQCHAAYRAFSSFQTLVREHEAAITAFTSPGVSVP